MSTAIMQSIAGKSTEMALVGACAMLSLLATSIFFLYISFMLLRHARQGSNTYATQSVRFLKTQFGFLFCNLVLADFIQAIGFVMNLAWLHKGEIPIVATEANGICEAQGAFVELGDVAAAFYTVFIAAHTFLVLGLGFTPSKTVMVAGVGLSWAICITMTILGPILVQTESGPFYDFAGLWCFISPKYELSRLYLHYLWLFIACAVTIAFYVALFFILHTRAYSKSVSYTQNSKTPAPFKVDSVASKMLAYPVVYLLVVLPLSVYRIAGVAGKTLPQSSQAVVGCIFTLSGFANILLYCTTRNVFGLRKQKQIQQMQPYSTVFLSSAKESHGYTGVYAPTPLQGGLAKPEKAKSRPTTPAINLYPAAPPSFTPFDEKIYDGSNKASSLESGDLHQVPRLSYDSRSSYESRRVEEHELGLRGW